MPRGVSHGVNFWRDHAAAHKTSGLTLGQYCAKHGLNKKTFSGWRRRLKGELRKASREASVPAEGFLQVDVGSEKSQVEAPLTAANLRNGSGVTLQVSDCQVHLEIGFDPATLRALIQELRQP